MFFSFASTRYRQRLPQRWGEPHQEPEHLHRHEVGQGHRHAAPGVAGLCSAMLQVMTRHVSFPDRLPHRQPALLLERAEVQRNGSISLLLEPSCHYLDREALTTAGIVELLAQAAALSRPKAEASPPGQAQGGMLIGLEELTIHHLPRVGSTLTIDCRLSRQVGPAIWVAATMLCESRLAATGTVKIYLTPVGQGP